MRLDQWLWAVRLYKSRTLAVEGIRGGHVKVDGTAAKPAREIRLGERIEVRMGPLTRTFIVIGHPANRLSAKKVSEFATDLTPPEEYRRARDPVYRSPGLRPRGAGRPTKRERRQLDTLNP